MTAREAYYKRNCVPAQLSSHRVQPAARRGFLATAAADDVLTTNGQRPGLTRTEREARRHRPRPRRESECGRAVHHDQRGLAIARALVRVVVVVLVVAKLTFLPAY